MPRLSNEEKARRQAEQDAAEAIKASADAKLAESMPSFDEDTDEDAA